MNYLLLCIPLSLVCEYLLHTPPVFVFITGALSIIPLAEWIRRGTEQLAHRLGTAIGGLLNVTFGNLAELILTLYMLTQGKVEIAKAQITGSIIGNGLLGLGLGIVVGTWGRHKQTFRRERAGLLGSLLILSVIGLCVPALFDYTERGLTHIEDTSALDEKMSLGVATVLILLYAANLIYSLVTHRDIFSQDSDEEEPVATLWSTKKAVGLMVGCSALVAIQAELVSGTIENAANALGVTPFFLGITAIAIVGNAAEYAAAIYFGRKNMIEMVMAITVGGTIQIALFVAPLLVIISKLLGTPMDLVFANPLELIAIACVAFAVNSIAHDGEATWFEGVLLLGVYTILCVAFFFVTP